MTSLEEALLAAHAAQDTAALVDLYAQAADATDDPDRAAFFLTHAYVYALEIDHPATQDLRKALIAAGRETPLAPAMPPRR